jgi:thiamine-phosphate pyrophosphorylase
MNAARPHSLSSLYIILDPSVCPARPLVEVLTVAAEAGAPLFQYRNKTASMKEAYGEALALRQAAAKAGVLFIVNDRCDLALAVDADGVHLGQGDLPLDLARRVMGPDKLIGISTHNLDQVRDASAEKPNYSPLVPSSHPAPNRNTTQWLGLRGYVRCAGSRRCPSLRLVAFRSTRRGR